LVKSEYLHDSTTPSIVIKQNREGWTRIPCSKYDRYG